MFHRPELIFHGMERRKLRVIAASYPRVVVIKNHVNGNGIILSLWLYVSYNKSYLCICFQNVMHEYILYKSCF